MGIERSYSHVARAFFDTPWFIREAEGSVIGSVLRGRLAGEPLSESEITARVEAARAAQGPRNGGQAAGPVAVIPVYGIIMPRANLMTEMSGGTTVAFIRAALEESILDKDIAAVVAEFDSPGGSVEGIEELATWIRENRGQKPMVAVVNTMACSAAYYLAAQFDEIVVSPSSLTGNIGVFTEHTEYSRMDEEAGVTTTIIRQPESKHDINDTEPLADAGRAHLQMVIDDYYAQFVNAVAKGRGVNASAVREGYGQGRELTAGRAKSAGLADRVDTLDNTIRRLASGRGRAAMQPAADGDLTPDHIAALASGLLFSERLELASALAADIAASSRTRADLRAEEGRVLSAATRDGLRALAESLRDVAGEEDEPVADEEPGPPQPASAGRRVDFEVLEAATRGGYRLPEPVH